MTKLNEAQLVADLDAITRQADTSPAFLAEFPFLVLAAYGMGETRIRRMRQDYRGVDLSGAIADLIVPKLIHYRGCTTGAVDETMEGLKAEQNPKKAPGRTAPRFLIVTDGAGLRIEDLKTGESLKGDAMADLEPEYDLLLPLAGKERYVAPAEREADVKAARHMRELVDAIRANDPAWSGADRQEALNTFATRILFCLYADSAGILDSNWTSGSGRPPERTFASMLTTHAVQKDGTDMKHAIEQAFDILDIPEQDPRRANFPLRHQRLRYVNGDLFRDEYPIPTFDRRARESLKRALDLDWKDINADIFGSMIQAIAADDERSDFGMHYTSVPNIMKVLGPLFINKLDERLDDAKRRGDRKVLQGIIHDVGNIHVFDPACGSGNFLIIAYRELRRIEREAMAALGAGQLGLVTQSGVRLEHFHGIDPNDFACRTARLSLWISQIQADRLMADIGLTPEPILPLHDAGDIHMGSALEIDWDDVVSPASTDGGTIYIAGNPPYIGSRQVDPDSHHKDDMDRIFASQFQKYRSLDYVSAWFKLMVDHIRDHGSRGALVTTNSLCQGESVPALWPWVYDQGVEIFSAHTSFKWRNSAAKNAGVTCAIIAMRRIDDPTREKGDKHLHVTVENKGDAHIESKRVDRINAYLTDGPSIIVEKESDSISGLPAMLFGNMPNDGGHTIMTINEVNAIRNKDPEAQRFIKPYLGSNDMLNGVERYCLRIAEADKNTALSLPSIRSRMDLVSTSRLKSKNPQCRELAKQPWRYYQGPGDFKRALMIPAVSSENRQYVVVSEVVDAVVSNSAFLIPNPPLWLTSVLSTRMMHQWLHAVGGKLKTDTRFSNTLVYNTFPVPTLTDDRKAVLDHCARAIIKARRVHLDEGKTLAWLYGADMPDELRAAHEELDLEYETMCAQRPFRDNADRLAWLFREYEKIKKRYDGRGGKR